MGHGISKMTTAEKKLEQKVKIYLKKVKQKEREEKRKSK